MVFSIKKKIIESKLHEFAHYLIANNGNEHINLVNGAAGEILFLCYYSRYFKEEKISPAIYIRLNNIINSINSGNQHPTLAGGLCGINWLLEHLVKEEFIDFNLNELYEDSDDYLNNYMIHFIQNKNYDYLHGALGIANYFLNRNTIKTTNYLINFIKGLAAIASEDKEKEAFGFKSIITNTGNPFWAYNFCLSHGMASIIYFLQKCLLFDPFKCEKEIYMLLIGLQNFFYKNQNDMTHYNSYFPTWLDNVNGVNNARIAWCYGDVGIGVTFINYGVNHSNVKNIVYGTEILTKTLTRKDVITEKIVDAGICHGSSGLSMIYERAYALTKKKEFLKASDYWLNIALNQSDHSDGICGYKSYAGAERGFINETGLLEGISGVGLVFLSKLDKNLGNWKNILMIS